MDIEKEVLILDSPNSLQSSVLCVVPLRLELPVMLTTCLLQPVSG